jgi:hypothetical protein
MGKGELGSAEKGLGSEREWGMGNGEWVMGNGEWGDKEIGNNW